MVIVYVPSGPLPPVPKVSPTLEADDDDDDICNFIEKYGEKSYRTLKLC